MDEPERASDSLATLCAAAGQLAGPCTNASEWTAAVLCGAAGHITGQCARNSTDCVFAGCANATDAVAAVLSTGTDGRHPLLTMMLIFAAFCALCMACHILSFSCTCAAHSAMLACACVCSPCLLVYAKHRQPKLLDGFVRSDAPEHAFEASELQAAPEPPRSWLDRLADRAVEMHEARSSTRARCGRNTHARQDEDAML
jgi:hypothetical protein